VPLTRLPGRPLGQVSGDRAEEAVITDLAMLLDRLAELGPLPAIAAVVSPADPDHWPRFASRVRHVLYPLMSAQGRQRADAELAAVTAATAAGGALVHTDLGGANLLWTPAAGVPRLAGILDWDHARIGDQASDLASIAATIGWPLAHRIDARRHRSTGRMLADAKIIAGTFALQQALPAALSGDQAGLDEGLRQYQ